MRMEGICRSVSAQVISSIDNVLADSQAFLVHFLIAFCLQTHTPSSASHLLLQYTMEAKLANLSNICHF